LTTALVVLISTARLPLIEMLALLPLMVVLYPGSSMRAAMPCGVIRNRPLRPLSEKTGSAGSPSTKDRSVSAILMTGEPLGRNDCWKEMKLERVMSAVPSVSRSRPRLTSPEAAMVRARMSRAIVLPPPMPTMNPLTPNVDPAALKSITGAGGPVGVAPPVVGVLAPLMLTARLLALSDTPGTPTSRMPPVPPPTWEFRAVACSA